MLLLCVLRHIKVHFMFELLKQATLIISEASKYFYIASVLGQLWSLTLANPGAPYAYMIRMIVTFFSPQLRPSDVQQMSRPVLATKTEPKGRRRTDRTGPYHQKTQRVSPPRRTNWTNQNHSVRRKRRRLGGCSMEQGVEDTTWNKIK